MKQSPRVLVVDDYEVIRKIHINNLRKLDILNIDEAVNGKQALTAVASHEYDLIVMDFYMPEMNGVEAMKILRASGFSKPILMCTDEAEEAAQENAKKNGAIRILKKPYFPNQFRSIVLELLNTHTLARD